MQVTISKEPLTSVVSDWKMGNRKKTKLITKDIHKGENMQISSIQAVQKKKFLHVWSLHPDTSEEAIIEHVKSICGTNDIKVDKIIPKTKRDYSSFMVGVPESLFDKINKADSYL